MKWFLVALLALVAAADVAAIGKPRGPVTPLQGIFSALLTGAFAAWVAVTW